MTDDVCKCYDNWGVGLSHDSGDCSERICPFEISWVDTPNKVGQFHKYAECANRGICNRDSGECACFDGYEGKGCQRTTCPNDCSGHGTCEYIEDMHFASTWNDFTPSYFRDDAKTFNYRNWDKHKTRGCVCDALYGDVDCSKRMCPHGTDVLDVRDNLLVSTKYQVQTIHFLSPGVDAHGDVAFDMAGDAGYNTDNTFALTFRSKLNESFTTIPIVYTPWNHTFAHDIQSALLNLPNKVIDGIHVASTDNGLFIDVNITFTGPGVQGPQNLITVQYSECSEGCTPRITGLELETRYNHMSSNITEVVLADYNSYECGRRGKCDYSTGICGCFSGYTGDNCNTQTTLV